MGWAVDAPSDDALVSGLGDQNQEALAEIYRRHGGAVWAVAKRVCGRGALAQDVCESVFTELWSRHGRPDPARGSLRAWLVARAHARAVEAVRAAKARPHPDGAAALDGDGELPRAVDQLAGAERDAILLAYLGGHTCSETARLLGTSEAAVKSHIRRGLVNLRQTLDAEGVTR